MIRFLATAAATAALVLGAATPAAAASKSHLELSYQSVAGYAAAVLLDCHPPAGWHPKPKKACNTLKKVGGKPHKLKPAKHQACTLEYEPITVEISGTWKGAEVQWRKTYPNPCFLARATGVLFEF